MRVNLSFAGAATYDAFRFIEEESLSWRTSHEADRTAREDSGEGQLFQTIVAGPLVGTELGEPIGALQGQPPSSAELDLGSQSDWSSTNTFIESHVAFADASEIGEPSGNTDDTLQSPEPTSEGLHPSLEVLLMPPADHIESSNAWYVL